MKELLQKAKKPNTAAGGPADEEHGVTEASEVYIFQDVIEPGEQGKINRKEPGEDPVTLTTLKRDNAANPGCSRSIITCGSQTKVHRVMRTTILWTILMNGSITS